MDSGNIDKWRAYFSGSNSTIFDVIENAIFVAALDHPQEFKVRREQLASKLFTCDLIKCSLCEVDFSNSGRILASIAATASANESRVKWSKSLADPDFANFQHDREDNLDNIILHNHAASEDGLSITVEGNCVRQRQSVVGLASPVGSENLKDYQNNCFSNIKGVNTLAVKAREENRLGSKKEQECNIVVDRRKLTGVDQVDKNCSAEALKLVDKITDENTIPSYIHEEGMPLETREHDENLGTRAEHFTFASQEDSSRKTRMSNEFEVLEMTNLGCRDNGNLTFINQGGGEKSGEFSHISVSFAEKVHDGRQAQTEINHVNEEAKMLKLDCLNGCTFSEAQPLVNDTAEENQLIKENDIGSYCILEIEEDDKTLKEATKINKALRNNHTQNDLVTTELLQKLQEMDLNIQILRATMIGETVTSLRKHGSKQIRKLTQALIRKWKMVVDEWVEAQAANSGGLQDTEEPPLDLHQENLPDSFSNGGVPPTPTCTPLDLIKLYDDVDDKHFFSNLPYGEASPVIENVNKEQDSTHKLSLIVKELELKLSKNTENGPRATPDRNGAQSPLEKEPLHTRGVLQASQEHTKFPKDTVERALQARECNEICFKRNSSSFDTHSMSQRHRTGELGERITSEFDLKGNYTINVQHQHKQNIANRPQKTVERFGQAMECNDLRSKLKSSLLDTHKREQLIKTGHLGKRIIQECDRKGKGVAEVQHQLKQNTVNSLQACIERARQAKECKAIQPKLKSSSFDTHKRAQLNETGDLGRRNTSPCDWKAKGAATDAHRRLKSSSLGTHKREQLNQTGFLGKRITSDNDLKAKGVHDVQHRLKKNTANSSQATHHNKLKSLEDVERMKLEEATEKLRAGYQDHKNAKKRRAVQLIDPKFVKDMNRKHQKKQLI